MARGVNKAIILGNVGQDPETRQMSDGTPVANMRVATSENWKDKNGERQERTEWHNVVCWRQLADIVTQYVKKGSKVYIEGKLQTRMWEKDGQKHYATEIVADQMLMLDSRDEGQAPGRENHTYNQGPSNGDQDQLPF